MTDGIVYDISPVLKAMTIQRKYSIYGAKKAEAFLIDDDSEPDCAIETTRKKKEIKTNYGRKNNCSFSWKRNHRGRI
jgi:hypothetical protein